jgi:Tol biopolymer transport system component
MNKMSRRLQALLFIAVIFGFSMTFAQNATPPTKWTPEATIKYKRLLGTAISPDGKWLAFASSRGGEKNNLWLIRPAGGEAEKLTDAKNGVNNFLWSPDGKRLAYTMNDPLTEQEEKDNKEKRDATVVDENFKFSHLYVIPVDKNEKGERPTKRLTKGEFHVGSFDWSPDGKWLVFDHQATPRVFVMPVSGGKPRAITTGGGIFSGASFSKDTKMMTWPASIC